MAKSLNLIKTSSQYVQISDATQTGLDLTSDLTFMGWFKFSSAPEVNNTNFRLITKWAAAPNSSYTLNWTYTDALGARLVFAVSANGTAVTSGGVTFLPTVDTWYHITAVYDASAGTVDIYVNASQVGVQQSGLATSIYNSGTAFVLGNFSGGSQYFDGRMAEIGIYNATLSLATIQSDYNLGYGTARSSGEGNIVAGWNFSDNLLDVTANNNDLANINAATFSTDSPLNRTLTLTDITDNKIFSRVVNEASVTVSGTYTGKVTTIEARVVEDGTSTEVVTWTEIDAAPSGGTFSGAITVPEGGMYNVQARDSVDTTNVSNGANAFGVGMLVAFIGQSQGNQMFLEEDSPDTPDATLRMYESGWATCTGNGAIKFGNTLITTFGIPVGLMKSGVGGSALYYEARAAAPNDNWWLDEIGHTSDIWDDFITAITAVGGNPEYIIWMQGEQDAISELITEAEYLSGFSNFRTNQIIAEVADIPIIISCLAKITGSATDATWQGIKNAQKTIATGGANLYFVNLSDMVLRDTVHWTAASYETAALRLAQAIFYDNGDVLYYRGATILGYTQISSAVIDVTVQHNAGTDFTPTTGITGFTASDDGGAKTISSAVRQSSSKVRITFSTDISGTLALKYQYGRNPVTSGELVDNTGLTLPVEYNDAISELVRRQMVLGWR